MALHIPFTSEYIAGGAYANSVVVRRLLGLLAGEPESAREKPLARKDHQATSSLGEKSVR